jgi:hypothetical protein
LSTVARNIFTIITAILVVTRRKVCQYSYTCTEKKAPDHSEVYVIPDLWSLSIELASFLSLLASGISRSLPILL